jgi:hypothetical protein
VSWALVALVPAIASAQTSTIKLAYWSIRSGKGEPALPGWLKNDATTLK